MVTPESEREGASVLKQSPPTLHSLTTEHSTEKSIDHGAMFMLAICLGVFYIVYTQGDTQINKQGWK